MGSSDSQDSPDTVAPPNAAGPRRRVDGVGGSRCYHPHRTGNPAPGALSTSSKPLPLGSNGVRTLESSHLRLWRQSPSGTAGWLARVPACCWVSFGSPGLCGSGSLYQARCPAGPRAQELSISDPPKSNRCPPGASHSALSLLTSRIYFYFVLFTCSFYGLSAVSDPQGSWPLLTVILPQPWHQPRPLANGDVQRRLLTSE